ncbi:hypothetical protein VTL71DRAFT_10285 [Oculimacula yallundae]|uniref:Peptidase S8/S53 domain-containing protein n=1 Tax=Oculimacula yallundae TaxID=86028 RepID=A0ABR4CUW2_9HELO
MRFNTLLTFFAAASLVASTPLNLLSPILKVLNDADVIPNKWIIVMKDMSDSDFDSHLLSRPASIISGTKSTFNFGGMKGYTGTFSQSLLELIASGLNIAWIEPDTVVNTQVVNLQSNAPWGLGRISRRAKGSTTYRSDSSAGEGTYVYVLDTGIYTAHREFEGRATFGANFVGDGQNTDSNGHGTHVAGTIGSRAYGVAKKTNLIDVKVLGANGAGAISNIINGIQWAVNDMKSKGRVGKALANLSLGSSFSQAVNDAVAAAVQEGLFMGVAAGNANVDVSGKSPASAPTACTVAASDEADAKAYYSNFGSLVDVFAPGSNILSTWIGGVDNTNTVSGTSMATPHVVGLAAYFIRLEGSRAPVQLCDRLKAWSSKNILTGVPAGTPNVLVYNANATFSENTLPIISLTTFKNVLLTSHVSVFKT